MAASKSSSVQYPNSTSASESCLLPLPRAMLEMASFHLLWGHSSSLNEPIGDCLADRVKGEGLAHHFNHLAAAVGVMLFAIRSSHSLATSETKNYPQVADVPYDRSLREHSLDGKKHQKVSL
jgi:hypothetical protein